MAILTDFLSDFCDTNRVRPYFPFRGGYYIHNGVILYHDRVVVPLSLRRMVLSILRGAHQRVSAKKRRARSIVFWFGMTNDIHAVRAFCVPYSSNALSQAATLPISSKPPATPFEKIFAGNCDYGARHFLVIGDRFSGWADMFGMQFGTNVAGAAAFVGLLRAYFAEFGSPEEISTDGGLEFTAFVT